MGESPKVEARLGKLMETALSPYMEDRHLQNESEVLRSALGKFLDNEGYIAKAERVLESPASIKTTRPIRKVRYPGGKRGRNSIRSFEHNRTKSTRIKMAYQYQPDISVKLSPRITRPTKTLIDRICRRNESVRARSPAAVLGNGGAIGSKARDDMVDS